MGEREELLDAGGRYAEAMYDRLAVEVREAAQEAFEERAAIIEYDGGLPRREAEALAWKLVSGWEWWGGGRTVARPRSMTPAA